VETRQVETQVALTLLCWVGAFCVQYFKTSKGVEIDAKTGQATYVVMQTQAPPGACDLDLRREAAGSALRRSRPPDCLLSVLRACVPTYGYLCTVNTVL
jgi:hypothetical protein